MLSKLCLNFLRFSVRTGDNTVLNNILHIFSNSDQPIFTKFDEIIKSPFAIARAA